MNRSLLLTIDSIINLVLGALLMFFPRGLASFLGIPQPESAFYPSILGAVLFGIGIALGLELRSVQARVLGLGLGGAIAINLSGALVLALWLIGGGLSLPAKGLVALWAVVALLIAVSLTELRHLTTERLR